MDKFGTTRTAYEMALKSHNLSRDGMSAKTPDGNVWKWSDHFRVWVLMVPRKSRRAA